LPQQALDDFNAAIAIRPDCPQLMLSLLYWHPHLTDGQGDDDPDKTIQWQMPLLARIEILDPENVDGDLYVAEAQSANTERMLKILKGAADRSHHDPKVMMRIARTLVDPLRKRMDWDYDLDKRERNKHLLVGAPEVPMFVDAIKTGLASDEWMYPAQENLAWLITAADPNYGDFWPTVYNYNNRHWKAARDEQNAGHYEASIEHARRVMEVLSTGEAEILRYYIVRGLWKLKRYREAIYEAELGAYYFPDKPTFHYMFALVAWDMNERLEEAYERAKIAVELQPSNEGAQQIYKKLAKRLGK
jgi:tetratricopeptide (TPR) repeat protein